MIEIDNVLVTADVINEHFVCDLNKCKGACCVEGDLGAPLEEDELVQLEKVCIYRQQIQVDFLQVQHQRCS